MGDIAIQEHVDYHAGGKFVVVSACEVSCDDVVRIGRFLGILEEKQ